MNLFYNTKNFKKWNQLLKIQTHHHQQSQHNDKIWVAGLWLFPEVRCEVEILSSIMQLFQVWLPDLKDWDNCPNHSLHIVCANPSLNCDWAEHSVRRQETWILCVSGPMIKPVILNKLQPLCLSLFILQIGKESLLQLQVWHTYQLPRTTKVPINLPKYIALAKMKAIDISDFEQQSQNTFLRGAWMALSTCLWLSS